MGKPKIVLKAGMSAALEGALKKRWEENQHLFPEGANQDFIEKLIENNLRTFADRFLGVILWKANHELNQSAPRPKEGGH
ncbi:MAG: hypothetical protein WC847_00850 [Candidatus Paceibacterota bacterium]|jgi:hypothetical protein